MKRQGLVLTIIALMMSTVALAACTSVGLQGSGNVITETRQLGDFKEVEVSGTGKIYVQQGSETKLTIEAEDNIMPLLESKIENNKLKIGPKDGSVILSIKSLNYYLTIKDISKIALSGVMDLEADNLSLSSLKVELSGAGTATLNGKTDQLEIQLSGVGKYAGAKFEAQNAKIQLSGAGMADVTASNQLDVQISGAGTVVYGGNPKITKNISGLGDLKQR